MEFFLAEFNLQGDVAGEGIVFDGQSLILPGAAFCWNASSSLVQSHTQGNWTIFLWGTARYKTEEKANSELAQGIALDLSHAVSLRSILTKLEGNFGLLAWNKVEKKLQFATDPIGMTRIYFFRDQAKMIVSSHAQLVAKKIGDLTVSPEGISILFSLNGIPAPHTIFQKVAVLKPAELITCTAGQNRSEDYWSLLDQITPFKGTLEDAENALENLLDQALHRIALSSRAPIGVSMSGGVDSALLAGLMVREGIQAQGLTVGYNPPTRFDEAQAAAENARLIGFPIDTYRVTDQDISNLLALVIKSLPEPLGDAAILPQLFMTLAGRGKVSAVIDGTGADNIFGGMIKFRAAQYAKQYRRIPRLLRENLILLVLNALPSSRKSGFTDQVRRMQKFAYGVELPERLQEVYWSRFMPQNFVQKMIAPAWKPDGYLADEILLGIRNQVPSTYDDFFTSTFTSIRGTMPIYATQKLMAIQYASGVRLHVPFTTPGLIEFALSLPAQFKLTTRDTKLVLRRTAEKILPAECTTRKKANFSPPIGRWMTGIFKEEFMDLLNNNAFFNTQEIEQMMADQTSGWRDWQWQLWLAFVFLKWMREVTE